MSNGDNVRRGCLFGFGFAFGSALAGVAVIVSLTFAIVFLSSLAIPRRMDQAVSPPASPASTATPQPPRVETHAGVKGRLIDHDGDYVDIRLPDGRATWVRLDSLTEESQRVVQDGFPDNPTEPPQ